MPDLLLELLSDEIPARMQARAAEDLKRLVTDALVAQGFLYEGAGAFVTPRRLALTVAGLPAKGKDVREERKGPRVGAPEAALSGFLKAAGVESTDQVKVAQDAKKGDYYVAVIERPGRPTIDVLAEILPGIIQTFPWPKSMRWGAASREPGSLRWVRPLTSIVATFGAETESPDIVPFAVGGIAAGDTTRGHRFMAPDPITVRRFDDYAQSLEAARVVLDAGRRRDIIRHDARDLAFAQGYEVIEDEALLDEVAGLVEWPVVLMGAFDESFLDIPPEAIRATIRANQKCFVLRGRGNADALSRRLKGSDGEGDGAGGTAGASSGVTPTPDSSPQGGGERAGALANRFILVANIEARDGGAAIVAGNERVVRARLADAKFFWDTDRKPLSEFADRPDLKPLDGRLERMRALGIVFHEKLGTQYERVERIAALARELAPVVGADPDQAERAARLAKADLVTEMVGEFPELQGLMGRYYAAAQGEDPSVAAAIEEHYRPLGPSDRVPPNPVSIAVALADKLDTLVGFWAIDEKPTGSKDPFALRRAALGVIRLVLENGVRIGLVGSTQVHVRSLLGQLTGPRRERRLQSFGAEANEFIQSLLDRRSVDEHRASEEADFQTLLEGDAASQIFSSISLDLIAFVHDRLKVYLRDRGTRHDLIDAVLSAGAPASPPEGESLPSGTDPRVAAQRPEGGGAGGTSGDGADGGPTPTPDPSPQGGGEGGAASSTSAPHAEVPTGLSRGPRSKPDGAPDHPSRPASPAPQDEAEFGTSAAKGSGAAGSSPPAANDDLLMIVRRVEALGRFLETEDGRNLTAATKRAANILRIEEKKDGRSYDTMPDLAALALAEERTLAMALAKASGAASDAVKAEDFEGAMRALAELRPAVDAFFEGVTVNADDPALRENRLKLLSMLRRATREVADFSKIEG